MRIAAIITEDFDLYHSLVNAMKKDRTPFITLGLDEKIPTNVVVVVTSKTEAERIEHDNIIEVNDSVWLAIDRAQHAIMGKGRYTNMTIGIDPGPRPGMAVLGDEDVIKTAQLESPEGVVSAINNALEAFPADQVLIRVGHGDPTMRNRTINALMELDITVEIVDETQTSTSGHHPHIDAAITIAGTWGEKVDTWEKMPTEPTDGEIREFQRRSRIASNGRVTISKDAARQVIIGEKTQDQAVAEELLSIEDDKEKG